MATKRNGTRFRARSKHTYLVERRGRDVPDFSTYALSKTSSSSLFFSRASEPRTRSVPSSHFQFERFLCDSFVKRQVIKASAIAIDARDRWAAGAFAYPRARGHPRFKLSKFAPKSNCARTSPDSHPLHYCMAHGLPRARARVPLRVLYMCTSGGARPVRIKVGTRARRSRLL